MAVLEEKQCVCVWGGGYWKEHLSIPTSLFQSLLCKVVG